MDNRKLWLMGAACPAPIAVLLADMRLAALNAQIAAVRAAKAAKEAAKATDNA